MDLVKMLKALADENRLRIMNMLSQGPLCGCEFESVFSMNQSNVSRHLQKLKDAGLILAEKRGQYVYYRIHDKINKKGSFLAVLHSELKKSGFFVDDLEKIKGRSC